MFLLKEPWACGKALRADVFPQFTSLLILRSAFFFLNIYYVCACFATCMSIYRMCAGCTEARRGHQITLELELQMIVSYRVDGWKLNLGPLVEQPVFLTLTCLQPTFCLFINFLSLFLYLFIYVYVEFVVCVWHMSVCVCRCTYLWQYDRQATGVLSHSLLALFEAGSLSLNLEVAFFFLTRLAASKPKQSPSPYSFQCCIYRHVQDETWFVIWMMGCKFWSSCLHSKCS